MFRPRRRRCGPSNVVVARRSKVLCERRAGRDQLVSKCEQRGRQNDGASTDLRTHGLTPEIGERRRSSNEGVWALLYSGRPAPGQAATVLNSESGAKEFCVFPPHEVG